MTDSGKATPVKQPTAVTNPESPTTARPLDFDDELQESGLTSAPSTMASTKPSPQLPSVEEAPAKPPRPPYPHQQIVDDLKQAFPTIDIPVIKAVVSASGGNMERAFNALLGMSDPDAYAQDDVPPQKPPRPQAGLTSTTQSQLEEDERYARQLAHHYGGVDHRRGFPPSAQQQEPNLNRARKEMGLKANELHDDREYSFIDDDLPIIKENIRKGFLETQSRVNTWVENFKKKLDGEDSEEEPGHAQRQYSRYNDQGYPNRRQPDHRQSVDRDRYDADPRVLGDDFSSLELRDNEVPPRRPPRPHANPDLFKSASRSPNNRKVSFQEGPPEEIPPPQESGSRTVSGNKSSKWQPLSQVEPSPVGENDPFSLGDSDDEKDIKQKDTKDSGPDQPQKAAAEDITEDIQKPKDTPKKEGDKA